MQQVARQDWMVRNGLAGLWDLMDLKGTADGLLMGINSEILLSCGIWDGFGWSRVEARLN